ncbi:unnamed protein product [Rotaria sp. Silwood2]|nr:unnamed protein product [Rotaria sp. Silwood2]CAF4200756.1 unnamed protein product [Rotaria sp. Silwood2]
MTSEQKDRICNGIDTQILIENFQRQEQLRSTSSTLDQQTIITTTTAHSLVTITRAGDLCIGICNTIGGGSGVNYPTSESPSNAIDGLLTTKYLNFGNPSSGCSGSSPVGINTGFYVTPSISNVSVAVGLLFVTTWDAPNRDPITVIREGKNATNTTALNSGTSWRLIYNGSTDISFSTKFFEYNCF